MSRISNGDAKQMYTRWTSLTATCYLRKMKCKNCPEKEACKLSYEYNNKYKIHPTKYSTLKIYANLGKEGLRKFLQMEREENELIQ